MAQRAPSQLVKDLDKLVKPLGWQREQGRGHVKYRGPDGKGMVVVSSSKCSDPRSMKNAISNFRSQGCPL